MDTTPYFVMGTLFGMTVMLAIQLFAASRVKRAVRAVQSAPVQPSDDILLQQRETAEMHRRLAVLENIVTDHRHRLTHEIDSLR